ncbi:2500_t:CDS:2 [Dentiscutata erythropus]|uniref:2500_t:CDS:1 n=1 Tax=Dentiscutata erythropus TaxID=1348616 RepID=A0A9N9N9W5_9GLOM|nr:2500_t:CDS:2 [Dentiscutata erythropus]
MAESGSKPFLDCRTCPWVFGIEITVQCINTNNTTLDFSHSELNVVPNILTIIAYYRSSPSVQSIYLNNKQQNYYKTDKHTTQNVTLDFLQLEQNKFILTSDISTTFPDYWFNSSVQLETSICSNSSIQSETLMCSNNNQQSDSESNHNNDKTDELVIQSAKLDCEAKHQRFSEYKNMLLYWGLSNIQSVFFKTIHDEIEKYLTIEATSIQSIQIAQSPLETPEHLDGYLEDEYDTLQASLETIINMVDQENILEFWRVSLFDQHINQYPHYIILLADNTYLCTCLYIISNGFFYSKQVLDSLSIIGTTVEHDIVTEMNQVISIRRPDVYQPSIYTIDEFVGLISGFIKNHTGININQQMQVDISQIENQRMQGSSSIQEVLQDLDVGTSKFTKWANIEANNNNIKSKPEIQHCGNCYKPGHYTTTCKFLEN